MRNLGVRAAAAELGVHENTVRRWEAQGIISAIRLPGSNFRRFAPGEIERLQTEMVRDLERNHVSDAAGEHSVLGLTPDPELWNS